MKISLSRNKLQEPHGLLILILDRRADRRIHEIIHEQHLLINKMHKMIDEQNELIKNIQKVSSGHSSKEI